LQFSRGIHTAGIPEWMQISSFKVKQYPTLHTQIPCKFFFSSVAGFAYNISHPYGKEN
jgi:hypothetical protein